MADLLNAAPVLKLPQMAGCHLQWSLEKGGTKDGIHFYALAMLRFSPSKSIVLLKGVLPQVRQRKKMEKRLISLTSHKSDKGIGLGLGLELSDLWDVALMGRGEPSEVATIGHLQGDRPWGLLLWNGCP